MSGSSDPLLISKKAARIIKGLNPIPGSLSVTQTRLIWQPNTFDKNKPGDGRSEAQTVKSVSIFLTNITSKLLWIVECVLIPVESSLIEETRRIPVFVSMSSVSITLFFGWK